MERKSESEEYDDEILVGLDGAGMVWVIIEVIVFDCVSGTRKRKLYFNKLEMSILRRDQ